VSRVATLLRLLQSAPRELSWALADRVRPLHVGDPAWVPSEQDKQHWRAHGWVLLRGSAALPAVDRLQREIELYRRRHREETTSSKTAEGLRIGLLHAANRTSREVALNDQARTFLRWAFADEPVLYGSLTFDVGSEQEPHVDASFFYTRPETSMAGVWTALEDIAEDAGPLFYVDRSHSWPRLTAAEVLAENPALDASVRARTATGVEPDVELSDEVYAAYSAKIAQLLATRPAARAPALLRKGDVFIWHPWLVHGGLPRIDRALTRRSMVAHYIGASAKMWNQQDFFLHGKDIETRAALRFITLSSRGRRYVWHPAPAHFSMGDGHFEA